MVHSQSVVRDRKSVMKLMFSTESVGAMLLLGCGELRSGPIDGGVSSNNDVVRSEAVILGGLDGNSEDVQLVDTMSMDDIRVDNGLIPLDGVQTTDVRVASGFGVIYSRCASSADCTSDLFCQPTIGVFGFCTIGCTPSTAWTVCPVPMSGILSRQIRDCTDGYCRLICATPGSSECSAGLSCIRFDGGVSNGWCQ